jgi:hypothetical protein
VSAPLTQQLTAALLLRLFLLLLLQASGYVVFDTAGQSNMYPVITKAYETGSAQDTLETGGANFAVGVGAGAIAVAVLAIGLTALSQQGDSLWRTGMQVDTACYSRHFCWPV